MKRKRHLWLVPLIVLTALAVGFLLLRVLSGGWVLMLLDRALDQEALSCSVRLESADFTGEGTVSWCEINGDRYYTVDFGSGHVYLHDEALYFSGGNGYDLEQLLDEWNVPDELPKWPILLAGFQQHTEEDLPAWVFMMKEKPDFLMEAFFPDLDQYWDSLRSLKISLREDTGRLVNVTVHHDAFQLTIDISPEQPKQIPTEDLMQISAASCPDARTLTPLFRALEELVKVQDPVRADLEMQVECGPLPIQDTAQMYLSREGLYIVRGGETMELTGGQADGLSSLFLGLGWMLCRDGVWTAEGADSGRFSLTIPSKYMESALSSILPELDGLGITLEDGSLATVIESNSLAAMTVTCSGQMPFLITTIPLEIRLELNRN